MFVSSIQPLCNGCRQQNLTASFETVRFLILTNSILQVLPYIPVYIWMHITGMTSFCNCKASLRTLRHLWYSLA